jgi:CheY-like chemotaxis protein
MTTKKRLLLVDDDDAVFAYLSAKLGSEFAIDYCASADDALRRLGESRPDLILCDIDLPGTDGGDLSAAVFSDSKARDIPFLFLTALLTPAELAARDNQLAGRAAVSKEAPIEEIRKRIRAAVLY